MSDWGEIWEMWKEAEEIEHDIDAFTNPRVPKRKHSVGAVAEHPNKRFRPGTSEGERHNSITPGMHRRINSGTMSKRGPSDGDEIQVVPPPKRVAKIAPDYMTIKLPWWETHYSSTAGDILSQYALRLNSCFDPSTQTPAHQPAGRDKFAAFGFRYYRVLKTVVRLRFFNRGGTSELVHAHQIVGYELGDSQGDRFTKTVPFVEGKHCKSDILCSNSTVFEGARGKFKEMTYTFTPESWDNHVHTEASEEMWTPIDSTPPLAQELYIHTGPAYSSTGNGTPVVWDTFTGCFIYVEYTVQFREQTYQKDNADLSETTVPAQL